MGDRCSVHIWTRPQDAKYFEDTVGPKWEEESIGCLFEDTESNYGAEDARGIAAEAGAVFYGSHSEGGSYPACAFASDGKTQWEWQESQDGRCCIEVSDPYQYQPDLDPDSETDRKKVAAKVKNNIESATGPLLDFLTFRARVIRMVEDAMKQAKEQGK